MSSKIEDEIMEATGFMFDSEWDREGRLKYLQKEVEKLSNDAWGSLSEEAQDWSDDAARAVLAHRDIPEFPDWEEDEDEQVPAEEEASEAEAVPGNAAESPAPAELLAAPEGKARPKKSKRSQHAKTLPPKTRKALKGAVKDAVVEEVPIDRYGMISISKASKAAALFEKGATMAQVVERLGGATHYNMLKRLEADGHKVERDDEKKITLTHKDGK